MCSRLSLQLQTEAGTVSVREMRYAHYSNVNTQLAETAPFAAATLLSVSSVFSPFFIPIFPHMLSLT